MRKEAAAVLPFSCYIFESQEGNMRNTDQNHSGAQNNQRSERELLHGRLARRAAAEGMVLLKNEEVLPLDASRPLALFGGGAVRTVKGGIGSGDVNSRESISVCQGLRAAGAVITSECWIEDYEKRYEAARLAWKEKILNRAKQVKNPFDAYAEHPFVLPDGRKIEAEDLKGASAAVYVISRIAGEGKDRRREEGDYYLSRKEQEDLCCLNESGVPIILLLNVGAPVELTDILKKTEHIKAVLLLSLPGQEGGHAAADVLFGRAVPGGRLTTTWARRYKDYPSAESFGYLNGNLETEEYREGIYVGYRCFDSFGIEPLFPFGYGLSYTGFSIKFEGCRETERGVEAAVSVKNTGNHYAGREVVQAYVTLPQTGGAKEYQRLVGFTKTGCLNPGEEERLTVSVEWPYLAGFSESLHAWIVEAGTYGLWIGNHAKSLQLVSLLTVQKQTVLEKTVYSGMEFPALDTLPATEAAGRKFEEWMELAREQRVSNLILTPQKEKKRTCQKDAFLAEEVPAEELIPLLYGNITKGTSTLGSSGVRVPGSAGETTEALEEKYGVRSLIMADGPAGLRLRQSYEVDSSTDCVYGVGVLGSLENGFLEETVHHEGADTWYQFCTAFPVGTALAQSWDMELMREFGAAVAEEMKEFHVDLWLAPGMNIHRNPLCGRNFEYYSEDPLLSGLLASAVTEGVQSRRGCGVTIKHFACNNQEDNRMGVDVRITERALREIYLRGFEIAVKKSAPAAMMSSYNQINGVHAANSRALCTAIAREEWGYDGVIMSDWNTTVPEDGSIPWKCIAAGNDLIMPGNPEDDENIRRAYKEGTLPETAIRRSAGRVWKLVRRLTGE